MSASKNTFSSKLSKGIPPERNWVKIKLSNMTLREKIGQMIISSTFGEAYDEKSIEFRKLKRLCEETRVGGFIFFKGTSSGYARLSNKLQEMSETPLLISADFERGTGMRVTDGTLFPNNMAIGATRNHELTYEMGLLVARESRILGVHQNYSPVCDVNNNQNNPIINVRSFGEDPILVSQMSEMMIKGLQEGKVIATAKHFPGHGDTDIDSHSDLPILYFSQERLNSVELVPFKNAIDRKVMSVMVAHLSVPELDPTPNIPSSLSNDIVEGLLIKRLGFDGLIVTDALNMKGITKYFSTSEVAVMSVNAGIDLILMPLDEKATIDAIEKAVKNGIISEERINKSAEKILKAKEWLGLSQNKYVNSADVYKSINTEENNNLSQKIADESITLVKDINNAIPIKRNNDKIIVFNLSDGKDNINSSYFNSKLAEKFPNLNIVDINSSISENTINEYSARASENEYIIIAIYAKVKFGTGKISILSSHIDLINDLSKNGKIIIISFGNPYLLKEFPATPCYICAYGDADVSINSLLKAISGEIKTGGKLPVSINDDYKYGTGISK
ncbi:MAG: glycoside hydrolase family 3 N-terminal domain-containing protein [Ignavibacteria bacterium]